METNERLALQAELFGTVFLIAQHLARRADAAMESVGLTTKQWLLLALLVKSFPGQTPTLSQAAMSYGTSRQNIKQIALQLEKRGFLRLLPDLEDRRALRLHLTEHVTMLDAPEERQRQAAMLEAMFAGLADQELATLRTLIHRWLAGIAPAAPYAGDDHA